MRAEQIKVFSAIASGLAVLLTVTTASKFFDYSPIFSQSTPIVFAMLGAAIAAAMSIFASRYLQRERSKGRVFIIYAHEDLEVAEKLYVELKERGFSPWMDKYDLLPGQVWTKSVMKALEGSQVAIALISEASKSKQGFIQQELKSALSVMQESADGFSPVIPVRLSEVEVPEALRDIHWVDLFTEGGEMRLFNALYARQQNQGRKSQSERL